MDDDRLRARLRLVLTGGVGVATSRRLVGIFGSERAAVSAGVGDLVRVPGVGEELARAIADPRGEDRVEGELEAVRRAGVRFVGAGEPGYPENLAETYDPPLLLYLRGEIVEQDRLAAAVVGARRCTPYGRRMAAALGQGLAGAGLTVVSGLARGVDAEAHRGALEAGGRTVAVLGSGLGEIYPSEHTALADRVAASGCLVSEFPMDAPPRAEHFPRRNRVVSGLSMGVVVVEAARRSGSLITARWAAEQGREVFAVPGPADSALSEGCHELLRDGATLVLGALEVVEALAPAMGLAPAVPCSGGAGTPPDSPRRAEIEQGRREGPEGRVWESLGSCPLTVDEVVEATGLAPAVVQSALARLDLSRVAWRGPGGTWTRAWTARPGGATRLASG